MFSWATARAGWPCRPSAPVGCFPHLRLVAGHRGDHVESVDAGNAALQICDSLATASIAAGGTLGILIPPSVILVIYGLLTEASVGKLFIAGVLPGIVGVLFYLARVLFRCQPQSRCWPGRRAHALG